MTSITANKHSGCIPSLSFLMAVIVSIFACNANRPPTVKGKTDSVIIAYAPRGTENWALARAIYTTGKKWAYGDSVNSEGQFKIDTISWKVFIPDTARDAKGKPIYDSVAKRWRPGGGWLELTEAQKQQNIIHILPKNK